MLFEKEIVVAGADPPIGDRQIGDATTIDAAGVAQYVSRLRRKTGRGIAPTR
jgi:hypothetical protein